VAVKWAKMVEQRVYTGVYGQDWAAIHIHRMDQTDTNEAVLPRTGAADAAVCDQKKENKRSVGKRA
jgi:hypothetical protein